MNEPCRVRVEGPLALHAPGFRALLEDRGYAKASAAAQLRLLAQLSRWLVDEHLEPEGLTAGRVERFVASRRRAGYVGLRSARALAPLLGYLRGLGVVPVPVPARSPVDDLLRVYHGYLVGERGLAPGTVRGYVDTARSFLSQRFSGRDVDLMALVPGDV